MKTESTFLEGPSLIIIGFILISNDSIRIRCCSSNSVRNSLHSCIKMTVPVLSLFQWHTNSNGSVFFISSSSFWSHIDWNKRTFNFEETVNCRLNLQANTIKLFEASLLQSHKSNLNALYFLGAFNQDSNSSNVYWNHFQLTIQIESRTYLLYYAIKLQFTASVSYRDHVWLHFPSTDQPRKHVLRLILVFWIRDGFYFKSFLSHLVIFIYPCLKALCCAH